MPAASVAMTVSPAPETSKTSRARPGSDEGVVAGEGGKDGDALLAHGDGEELEVVLGEQDEAGGKKV